MFITREVSDKLYWIGANDHRTFLFENIHPIPQGVSYNSYVLLDEKTAVFDAVDWSITREYFENLDHVLNGRGLDYFICNHLEPDHCSAMLELFDRYPECAIVATEKAFTFMEQFGYHTAGHEAIVAKTGDELSLGEHTITFIETPMVHWPEVMMTLDLTNGVLFSADAFGSFKALDGKLFADDVNYERDWLDEARRYYTNIVGKYGGPVTQAINKVEAHGDKLKMIAPLHGLIWRDNLGFFLDKYKHWASYTPEEKGVLIVYASMYGGTENAAQILASKICAKGMTNVRMYDVSTAEVSEMVAMAFKYSHIVFASVTYNLEIYPKMEYFLDELKMLGLKNRVCAVVENGTWAIKAGDLITAFLEGMPGMEVLENRVTITSTAKTEADAELDALAQAIVDSMESASTEV